MFEGDEYVTPFACISLYRIEFPFPFWKIAVNRQLNPWLLGKD